MINERRLHEAILRDLQDRIHDVVCAALTPRFSIAMAVLVMLGIAQVVVIAGWVSTGMAGVRTEIAAQGAAVDSTGQRVSILDGSAVRQPEIVALREEMNELKNANRSLAGTVSVVSRQQERIDASVSILSGYVKSLENRVGDEQQWRRDIMQELKGLGEQLRVQ